MKLPINNRHECERHICRGIARVLGARSLSLPKSNICFRPIQNKEIYFKTENTIQISRNLIKICNLGCF